MTETTTRATWSLDQVRAARRYYMTTMIDRLMLEQAMIDDVMSVVLDKATRALIESARSHAIEMHADDVVFVERRWQDLSGEPVDESSPDAVHLRTVAAWRPQTKAVELRGGPSDGTLLDVHFAGDDLTPLFVPVIGSLPYHFGVDQGGAVESLQSRAEYRLGGWRELERRWVYDFVELR